MNIYEHIKDKIVEALAKNKTTFIFFNSKNQKRGITIEINSCNDTFEEVRIFEPMGKIGKHTISCLHPFDFTKKQLQEISKSCLKYHIRAERKIDKERTRYRKGLTWELRKEVY